MASLKDPLLLQAARQGQEVEELQQHVNTLRQQCSRLQKDLRRVQGDNAALALELEQRERDLEEQHRRMQGLQGTIQDQRADIRSALDMVSGRCMRAWHVLQRR